MHSKILVLRFPKTEVRKPLVSNLAREFNLTFNILNAHIFPRKEGRMVLEVSGERKHFKAGIKYLQENGVHVANAKQQVRRNDDRCTQCGACTAVCPTSALMVVPPEMTVRFDQEKCSVCELCITACPTRAMKVRPSDELFFD